MFENLMSLLGTLRTKAGFATLAHPDDDPAVLSHIHPAGYEDVSDELADCGFPFAEVNGAGAFAPLCRACALHNSDQPWIQELFDREHRQ